MNIEQIKKDWEAHCKEHGVKGIVDMHKTSLPLNKSYWTAILFTENREGHIQYTNRSKSLQVLDFKDANVLITFYEKLMKEQDNV